MHDAPPYLWLSAVDLSTPMVAWYWQTGGQQTMISCMKEQCTEQR